VRRVMRWKLGGAATALALGVVGCTGVAWAATHVANGSYSGALVAPKSFITVKFKVTGAGRKVTGLTISDTPFYCQGGGRPIPERFANAPISKSGSFTSTGKFVIKEGPLKGQVGTKLKITGKFGPGRTEHGTLTATWTKSPECTGKSSYTTKLG
jgi:hypothetical protein